jgi:hypothetical protein
MADVPLPDVPCVRVRLIYTQTDNFLGGSRFYLSYSGSAPTGANCATLASDIAGFWNTRMSPYYTTNWALTEIDVLDIATDSGLSGQWSGSHAGANAGTQLTANASLDVEFGIARRYRGGKPRMFCPPASHAELADPGHWGPTTATNHAIALGNMMGDIEGLSIGSMGTLAHVNLSYYKGYTNVEIPGKRAKAIPTYRATALHDVVTSYIGKQLVGSQRRRRAATTP